VGGVLLCTDEKERWAPNESKGQSGRGTLKIGEKEQEKSIVLRMGRDPGDAAVEWYEECQKQWNGDEERSKFSEKRGEMKNIKGENHKDHLQGATT